MNDVWIIFIGIHIIIKVKLLNKIPKQSENTCINKFCGSIRWTKRNWKKKELNVCEMFGMKDPFLEIVFIFHNLKYLGAIFLINNNPEERL